MASAMRRRMPAGTGRRPDRSTMPAMPHMVCLFPWVRRPRRTRRRRQGERMEGVAAVQDEQPARMALTPPCHPFPGGGAGLKGGLVSSSVNMILTGFSAMPYALEVEENRALNEPELLRQVN